MTNTLAATLGVLIIAALIADQMMNTGNATLFLAREFAELIEWLAFWR